MKKTKAPLALVLLYTLMIPSFLYVTLDLTSLATGLITASTGVLILSARKIVRQKYKKKNITYTFILISFLLASSVYSYITTSSLKPFTSIALLAILFLSIRIYEIIENLKFQEIYNIFITIFIVLISLGWASITFKVACCGYQNLEKSVFPFSEQSHFALALGMIATPLCATARARTSVFIILNILSLSILFPNLTLLVFSFICIFVTQLKIKTISFKIYALTVPFLVFATISIILSTENYFSSRLSFQETSNLTTLVWLQGWELAYLNTLETYGLGLGLQALGLNTTILPETSSKIFSLSGKINNINDGGFLAAKLISEAGIIGLLAVGAFTLWIITWPFKAHRIYEKLNKTNCNTSEHKKYIFISTIAFSFLVEMFFRGYGYFSPGLVIFLSAAFFCFSQKNKAATKTG